MKIKLDPGAFLPVRAHATDAGLDLRSPRAAKLWFFRRWAVIDTGVHVEIPKGYVGLLLAKSGLNTKRHITCEGVIDAGYTGSIVVKLYKRAGLRTYRIAKGDKISQLVILPIITPTLELVDELEPTERGDNGFGSTGR